MALSYLGAYRLLNPVNTGQSTQLWQARDDRADRYVAIKTLSDKQKSDKKAAALLKQEYIVGKDLKHPGVIQILDYNDDAADRPFLVMEWYPHSNMKAMIRLGLDAYAYRVPELAVKAVEAVAYLNSQGWVHRDIKPDNFMVDDEKNDLKLIDFAIATRAQGFLAKLFGANNGVQGTRSYMSPEQIRGQAVDQRADMYSLACMLFEMVTGRPPYTGGSSNELLHKHLNAAIPGADSVNKNVTPEFAGLLRKALAKKAAERPSTTEDFLAAMRMVRIFKRNPVHPTVVQKKDE